MRVCKPAKSLAHVLRWNLRSKAIFASPGQLTLTISLLHACRQEPGGAKERAPEKLEQGKFKDKGAERQPCESAGEEQQRAQGTLNEAHKQDDARTQAYVDRLHAVMCAPFALPTFTLPIRL